MVKKATKKTTKKIDNDAGFEPNKMTFLVSAVAALSLVILGMIASFG